MLESIALTEPMDLRGLVFTTRVIEADTRVRRVNCISNDILYELL